MELVDDIITLPDHTVCDSQFRRKTIVSGSENTKNERKCDGEAMEG